LLANKDKKYYQNLIDKLNSLEGYVGWFSINYGGTDNSSRKNPFQLKNTMKLDAIRDYIDKMDIDIVDKSVLLTSLILALDKVDSTIGHYASYLSEWSPRSYKDLFLEVPDLFESQGKHTVLKSDIFEAVNNRVFDLAYFDPPYGSNNEKMPPSRVRYSSYYHIYTTVVLNDKPLLFGKANRRNDSRDSLSSSVFEEYKRDEDGHFIATKAIKRLIEMTNAKYILFSYSNGGRATESELKDIFNTTGEIIKVVKIDYKKNVMSTMKWTNEWLNGDSKNVEFLFLLKKK
jgi:adenine-specific DNA-methyltransferase